MPSFIVRLYLFFRKGYLIIHRGPLDCNESGEQCVYNPDKSVRGRVADRVFPSGKIFYSFSDRSRNY